MRCRHPLLAPERPLDGRVDRPPLANVAAKSTSGIYVPSCGSPTRLGLWQLRPNYPLGALTKECAATRRTKPARHNPPTVRPLKLALPAARRRRFESEWHSAPSSASAPFHRHWRGAFLHTTPVRSVPSFTRVPVSRRTTTDLFTSIRSPLPARLHLTIQSECAELTASRLCRTAPTSAARSRHQRV